MSKGSFPVVASPQWDRPRASGWWYRSAATWRVILLGYVPIAALAHLAWELVQLPLYTIWNAGTRAEIAFAVVHCTAGDVLIALSTLGLALVITRSREFADWNLLAVGGLTMALGVGYTILSERVNTARGYWAYADAMPVVPGINVGLSPVTQWLVIPVLIFAWLSWRRRARHGPPQQIRTP